MSLGSIACNNSVDVTGVGMTWHTPADFYSAATAHSNLIAQSIFARSNYARINAGSGGNVTVSSAYSVISCEAGGGYNPTTLSSIPNGTTDGQQVTIINNGPSTLTCSFGIRSVALPTGQSREWTWNSANSVWL